MTTNNETDIMVAATESTIDNGISMAAVASSVNNPYTFSITEDIKFSARCVSKSTDITVTIGNYYRRLSHRTIVIYYGYNNNAMAPISFGTCSPSTYKGVEIGRIAISFFEDEGGGYIRQVFLEIFLVNM